MEVGMCKECNSGFSKDEEYFSAFLASVISGSTEADSLRFPRASRTLARNSRLRGRIDAARHVEATSSGDSVIIWAPELERIERVIAKNAHGHLLYELGQAVELLPIHVSVLPRELLSSQQLSQFEYTEGIGGWPEVGSRLMLRLIDVNCDDTFRAIRDWI